MATNKNHVNIVKVNPTLVSSFMLKRFRKYLVDNGADLDSFRNNDGASPLFDAVAKGFTQITKVCQHCIRSVVCLKIHWTKILVKEGADVDTFDNQGWTALHEAADKGYSEIVQVVIPPLVGCPFFRTTQSRFLLTPGQTSMFSTNTVGRHCTKVYTGDLYRPRRSESRPCSLTT